MVEKGITGRIWDSIYWYSNANIKCMKDYEKKQRIVIYLILRCK